MHYFSVVRLSFSVEDLLSSAMRTCAMYRLAVPEDEPWKGRLLKTPRLPGVAASSLQIVAYRSAINKMVSVQLFDLFFLFQFLAGVRTSTDDANEEGLFRVVPIATFFGVIRRSWDGQLECIGSTFFWCNGHPCSSVFNRVFRFFPDIREESF